MPINDNDDDIPYTKSAYEMLNDPNDPFMDLYTTPTKTDFTKLNHNTRTDDSLKKLRAHQTKSDAVTKKMVKPYIQRVVKQADNPKPTNPMMLWHSKRQNHKLLKTTTNPQMREKLTQEIIEADAQIIKNLDEESIWMDEKKKDIGKQIDKEEKGTLVKPKDKVWKFDE